MNKKQLSERDICTKFITPSILSKGWDKNKQIREEVSFTDGRIIVYGKTYKRGVNKRADYILYQKSNLPIAIVEAKDNNHSIGEGIQQALDYADTLDVLFAFSSNGDGFMFHDKTTGKEVKTNPHACMVDKYVVRSCITLKNEADSDSFIFASIKECKDPAGKFFYYIGVDSTMVICEVV